MSACILSGFAKKKKFVGGVYACNGSDLPATQDFGTVQYQGPFEAAQTVPATEITYTIIGKTTCGDDIRRITTRTYSSRSVANQWGCSDASIPAQFGPGIWGEPSTVPAVSNPGHAFYGTSASNLRQNIIAEVFPNVVSTFQFRWSTGVFTYVTPRISITGEQIEYWHDDGIPGWSTTYASSPINEVSGLTLYYLDVNEVWTYDLV